MLDETTCENASNAVTVSSDPLLAKLLKRQRMDVSSQAVSCGVSGSTRHKAELDDYIVIKENWRGDPIEFWKGNSIKFPTLWKIAVNILAILAAAAGIERVWIIAGAVSGGQRRRMKSRRLETEVLLICNRSFIPKFS